MCIIESINAVIELKSYGLPNRIPGMAIEADFSTTEAPMTPHAPRPSVWYSPALQRDQFSEKGLTVVFATS